MHLEEKMPVLPPQVSSLSSLGPRPWVFRPRLLLSLRLSPDSVSLCLSRFFSLFPRECDPFGVVATGVTLVGPPGGPRTDSRRATRTAEGVRSCARADVLLSFDTLDDAPRCCESAIPFALLHERAKEIGWPKNAEYYRYIAIDGGHAVCIFIIFLYRARVFFFLSERPSSSSRSSNSYAHLLRTYCTKCNFVLSFIGTFARVQ